MIHSIVASPTLGYKHYQLRCLQPITIKLFKTIKTGGRWVGSMGDWRKWQLQVCEYGRTRARWKNQIEPDLTWKRLTNIEAKDMFLGFYNGNQAYPSSCLLSLLVTLSQMRVSYHMIQQHIHRFFVKPVHGHGPTNLKPSYSYKEKVQTSAHSKGKQKASRDSETKFR